jgi:O-succinylbenzoic acid--CoA ligase
MPTWGMTEAASQLATPEPAEASGLDFESAPGIAGRPLAGVEIRPADGREDELSVRAPMLFDGYLDTRGGPDSEGWFATGDRGFVDGNGRVRVTGRSADRIISGGENVDARAVERALRASGLVDEACVLGVPDAEWGQRVAAVVVSASDAAELDAWARAHLEPAERPRVWRRVDALPRTSAGKPDRAALLRLLEAGRPRTRHS